MDFYDEPKKRLEMVAKTARRVQSNIESLTWIYDTIVDLKECFDLYERLSEVNKKLVAKIEEGKALVYTNELLHDRIKSLNKEIQMLRSKDTPRVYHSDVYYEED